MTEGGQEFVIKRAARATGQGEQGEAVIAKITNKEKDDEDAKLEAEVLAEKSRRKSITDTTGAPAEEAPIQDPVPKVVPQVGQDSTARGSSSFAEEMKRLSMEANQRGPA